MVIQYLSTAQWLIVEIRTTTRLSSSKRIQLEFPENAWIGIFSTIPTVAPTNSYDGTTDKQFWWIWKVMGRSSWNMTSRQALIWWVRSLKHHEQRSVWNSNCLDDCRHTHNSMLLSFSSTLWEPGYVLTKFWEGFTFRYPTDVCKYL